MRHRILLTDGAARDLEVIYDYIAEYDSADNASAVLDGLMEVADNLAQFPERGSYPRELRALGIYEYRQAFFKSYRVIYRVAAPSVYIHLIVDGRRDMQSLLSRRLLDPP